MIEGIKVTQTWPSLPQEKPCSGCHYYRLPPVLQHPTHPLYNQEIVRAAEQTPAVQWHQNTFWGEAALLGGFLSGPRSLAAHHWRESRTCEWEIKGWYQNSLSLIAHRDEIFGVASDNLSRRNMYSDILWLYTIVLHLNVQRENYSPQREQKIKQVQDAKKIWSMT